MANLHDAISQWIEQAQKMGRPVPQPKLYAAA